MWSSKDKATYFCSQLKGMVEPTSHWLTQIIDMILIGLRIQNCFIKSDVKFLESDKQASFLKSQSSEMEFMKVLNFG